ncbi:MAG TPA: hypothetical protein VGH27_11220 [Streptosporangiaceae bacterium]|jgi:hypothetical protein
MTESAGHHEDAEARAKSAIAELVTKLGLRVQELENELVITNPRDPDRGQIHIDYTDGYVSWERVAWTYWGTLEGFEDVGEDMISVQKILEALSPVRA